MEVVRYGELRYPVLPGAYFGHRRVIASIGWRRMFAGEGREKVLYSGGIYAKSMFYALPTPAAV